MPKLTNSAIDEIEQAMGLRFPGLYRKLLVEFGDGLVGRKARIYHPSEIRELYEPFFDDPTQLFHPYFPFGYQESLQEMWVVDASRERAASIWHETVPDDWPEEEWLTYEEWIEKQFLPETNSPA